MKKIYILLSAFLFSGLVSGQQILDPLLKAKALNLAGKPGESVKILTEAIDKQKDGRLLLERAETYLSGGKYSEAIADYNSINLLNRQSGEYGLAKAYALKGDAATSVYHLEMNMKSPFRKSEKEILLDPAFRKIENQPEWRRFWKGEWYSLTEKSISEIEYYTSQGRVDDAASILTGLKRNYPDEEAVKYGESLINISAGKYAEAVKTLSDLLASSPDNEKYLRLLAMAQSGSSNAAGASLTYSKMLDLEIADADLYIQRAECYRKTGETEKAISDIEKYLSLYPEDRVALSMAGKLNFLSGDNIAALRYFSENLRIHPNDPACYVDRANSYFSSKSWNWAIKDYSMALDLEPGNSEVWLNKGISLLNSGKKDDACHDFREAFNRGNKRATEYISRHCIR
jgi:tetratricopeptide (TPR) repeat protein